MIAAVGIFVSSPGPVLFRAKRVGKNGKMFTMYKFRTMHLNNEKGHMITLRTDNRIFPFGRFLRKSKIDELPQLVNILQGEMSIVGPRPERPQIAEDYEKVFPEFALRLQAKAGLTGYAQVYGKYNTDPYEKLEFDLLYINNMSVLTDIMLIFATFSILFNRESTQGVEGVTALDYDADHHDKEDER